MVVLILLLIAGADVGVRHPAGAWGAEVPPHWHAHAHVNREGVPFHTLTPDDGDDPDALARGIWVFAMPIPTDEAMDRKHLAVVVSMVLGADNPKLVATARAEEGKLGSLEASAFDLTGERKGVGSWRGHMLVALQEDNFLVAYAGAPPEKWDAFRPDAEKVLATIHAPPPLAPSPPLPPTTQRLRDVSDSITASVPLLHALARNTEKPDSWMVVWTGSGFVIDAEGYLLTNRHVVDAGSGRGWVRESFDPLVVSWDSSLGREKTSAEVIAISLKDDLALLRVKGSGPFPFLPLADGSQVKSGDRIVAAGWPAPSEFGQGSITMNEGTLTSIERDARGRPLKLRHSARTTGGNSGGPVYDLDLGGVVGAHYQGLISHAKDFPEVLYHGAVPVQRIRWDFPQMSARDPAAGPRGAAERRALIAYYFLQERFGAAMFECRSALAAESEDGIAHAYAYRMSRVLGAPTQATEHLKAAMKDERSVALATAFAGRAALEVDDFVSALDWGQRTVALGPENPEGYFVQAHAQLGMGRFDEAARLFDLADAKGKGLYPEALGMRAAVPLMRWLSDQKVLTFPAPQTPPTALLLTSRALLEKSFSLWPSRNWIAPLYLSVICSLEGDRKAAIAERNRALTLGRGNADALLSIAWLDLLDGDYGTALGLLREAQRIRTTARGHLFHGWALLQHAERVAGAGKPEEARDVARTAGLHYRMALRRSPAASWAPAVTALLPSLPPPE